MSHRKLDSKNRYRSKFVNFRASPEEWASLEIAVKLAGTTKREYIISRLENRDIVVVGNPRVYKALRNQLREVLETLKRIEENSESELLEGELLATINLIAVTLDGLKNEEEKSPYPAR